LEVSTSANQSFLKKHALHIILNRFRF